MALTQPIIEHDFDALQKVVPGDIAYFIEGDVASSGIVIETMKDLISVLYGNDSFFQIGELAETPLKAESKISKLKTRLHQIPGRRSSSIELRLAGISETSKAYFEESFPEAGEVSIILVPAGLPDIEAEDEELNVSAEILVLAGLRWSADWSADADGLWELVLSSEFAGESKDRMIPIFVPGYEAEEEEPVGGED